MSTLGKQKYIFSPSSFGASIAQRDAKFVSLAGEGEGSWEDEKYLSGKPSWAMQTALETFTLNSGSTDAMLASMGLYWSVSGSGNTKTVEYVNNIITGSGMTAKHYSGLTTGHLSMISNVDAGNIITDATGDLAGWKMQQLTMPIDTSAVHNFCDAIRPGVIDSEDQLRRNAKFIVDFYNQCRQSEAGSLAAAIAAPFAVVDTFLTLPLSDLEITAFNTDITTDYATIDSEYNFWSQQYERVLSGSHPASGDTVGNDRPDEKLLPSCALQLCAEEMEDSNDTRRQIKEFNTLYTHAYDSTLGMITTTPSEDKASPAASSAGSTNFWNKGYPSRLNTIMNQKRKTDAEETITGLAHQLTWPQAKIYHDKLKNIIIDKDHIAAVGDPANKRENYPFYVDLQFKTDISTTISDALAECNLMDEFMIWLMGKTFYGPSDSGPYNKEYYEATSKWDFELTDNAASIEMTGDRMTVFKTNRATLQMNDFTEWLVDGSSIDTTDLDGIAYFTTSPDESGLAGCDSMKNKLYAMIFQGKLKEVADKWGHNTITNCWDSKPSYSDTVAYRIAKYDEAGTTLIQNIYLPNTSDIDLMRYIDTQVRYNDKYTYRIYAYQAMNVTDYIYDNIDLHLNVLHGSGDPGGEMGHSYTDLMSGDYSTDTLLNYANRWSENSLEYDQALAAWEPSITTQVYFKNRIQIVEVPIYAQKVKILDSAPLSPEVSLIPLKDSQHNMHIMLNNRTGREFLETVNIMGDSDADLHTDQAAAQRLLPGDKFLFESEERPDKFQIFRTEIHPTEWTDFQPYLHMEVQPSLVPAADVIGSSDASYGTNLYAHAVSVWDHISVNTKYYYTFRTVDVHGFISNPTEIYCVELVNNDGATYLLVEAVDFAPKVPKQKSINFTRYLKVAPRITQVMLDNSKYESGWDGLDGGLQLGVQDQTVWGKKFRFTIRSQKTGREIHMYADFKKTHTITPREKDYGAE